MFKAMIILFILISLNTLACSSNEITQEEYDLLLDQLSIANDRIEELESEVAEVKSELENVQSELNEAETLLTQAQIEAGVLRSNYLALSEYYESLKAIYEDTIEFVSPVSPHLMNNDDQEIEPITYFHEKTQITYLVEKDGRHISATDSSGKIIWRKDPFSDAGLEPYRFSKPVICQIGENDQEWTQIEYGGIKYDEYDISISYNSSQFGVMDSETGIFLFLGQD